MSKKILECQYCGTLITEKNVTCPNCGANCSSVIKEYQQTLEEEMKIENEKIEKQRKEMVKKIKKFGMISFIPMIIFFILFIAVVIFIIFNIMKQMNVFSPKKTELSGELSKETITENYSILLDKYEAYEYYDNFFVDLCNTKEGYQKVAFHLIIENKTTDNLKTNNILKDILLKAGDEQTQEVETKTDKNFCKVIQGKESYNNILKNSTILSGDKLSGYIGFEVPKNEEKLKLIINNTHIIEMDNPVYEK